MVTVRSTRHASPHGTPVAAIPADAGIQFGTGAEHTKKQMRVLRAGLTLDPDLRRDDEFAGLILFFFTALLAFFAGQ